jgi:hypothetical protein
MTLNERMAIANYIARTEGSTQPDGGFGPSAWKSCDEWQGTPVEPLPIPSMSPDDRNSAVASGQASVC